MRFPRAVKIAVTVALGLGAGAAAPAAAPVPASAGGSEPLPFGDCATGGVAVIGPGDLLVTDEADRTPPTVEVGAFSGTCGPVEVTARVGGVTARHRFEADANGSVNFERFSFDPCGGGEGSDLPDTAVQVTGRAGSVTVGGTLRLGPDTTKPKVKKIQSSPSPESKVEPGDRIRFEVVGKEVLPGATWQTGVQTLQVTGPEGLIDDKSGGRTAKACGNKSESLTINDTYRVRRGDPAVIEICGIAEDYAANEASDCAKYYKGEVWEGTFREAESTCPLVWEGRVQVVVAPNGSVTGGGSASYTQVGGQCALSASPGGGQASIQISGTRDRNAFHVTVSGPSGARTLDLNVAGKTAKGSTQASTVTFTMTLDCKSCDDEAVG